MNINIVIQEIIKPPAITMKLLQLITCILLPPLGVFLTVGVGSALLINILLTILGFIPGIIHAIWIYSKQAERNVNV